MNSTLVRILSVFGMIAGGIGYFSNEHPMAVMLSVVFFVFSMACFLCAKEADGNVERN